MTILTTFERYELKYLLTKHQKEYILQAMKPYMVPDQYGATSIRNIYFDTKNYRLIRHSIEHPAYKEKLRLRSYGKASHGADIFVELKKKYHSVVYKRRLALPEEQAINWLCKKTDIQNYSQIANEIHYFCSYYETLEPKVFLSYDREAFFSSSRDDFRVTFDENILYRQDFLSLDSNTFGTSLLEENQVLMEIKTNGGIPLWMTRLLTEQKIFKTSFSKYGTAYQRMFLNDQKGGKLYA
ncbi:MAG: polyphosphate polymerase domain-containing protein [Lachnospiraceae bacterium]